jgi:hypothetical protein
MPAEHLPRKLEAPISNPIEAQRLLPDVAGDMTPKEQEVLGLATAVLRVSGAHTESDFIRTVLEVPEGENPRDQEVAFKPDNILEECSDGNPSRNPLAGLDVEALDDSDREDLFVDLQTRFFDALSDDEQQWLTNGLEKFKDVVDALVIPINDPSLTKDQVDKIKYLRDFDARIADWLGERPDAGKDNKDRLINSIYAELAMADIKGGLTEKGVAAQPPQAQVYEHELAPGEKGSASETVTGKVRSVVETYDQKGQVVELADDVVLVTVKKMLDDTEVECALVADDPDEPNKRTLYKVQRNDTDDSIEGLQKLTNLQDMVNSGILKIGVKKNVPSLGGAVKVEKVQRQNNNAHLGPTSGRGRSTVEQKKSDLTIVREKLREQGVDVKDPNRKRQETREKAQKERNKVIKDFYITTLKGGKVGRGDYEKAINGEVDKKGNKVKEGLIDKLEAIDPPEDEIAKARAEAMRWYIDADNPEAIKSANEAEQKVRDIHRKRLKQQIRVQWADIAAGRTPNSELPKLTKSEEKALSDEKLKAETAKTKEAFTKKDRVGYAEGENKIRESLRRDFVIENGREPTTSELATAAWHYRRENYESKNPAERFPVKGSRKQERKIRREFAKVNRSKQPTARKGVRHYARKVPDSFNKFHDDMARKLRL